MMHWLIQHKYFLFCISLVVFIWMQLVDPRAASVRDEGVLISIFHALIVGLIGWELLSHKTQRLLWIFAFLMVVFFSRVAYSSGPETMVLPLTALTFRMAFIFIVIWQLVAYQLGKHCLERDDIFAAIAVYLLIGLGFSDAYLMLLVLDPAGTLNVPFSEIQIGDVFYFSFITLSTVGYGDLIPLSPAARGLSILEGVLGVTFLATMVARAVSLQKPSPTE
ncbi:MAG: potassium channel family protein [Verrucomicrobiota bacterium]